MSVVSYTREHIERFAKALARHDREEHPDLWVSNTTIIAALRGHALCFANAHRIHVVLTNDDIAGGLKAYRQACGWHRSRGTVYRASAVAFHGKDRHRHCRRSLID
jgi:hypothetical protein